MNKKEEEMKKGSFVVVLTAAQYKKNRKTPKQATANSSARAPGLLNLF